MGENYKVDRIRETMRVTDAGDTQKIFKVRAIGPGETSFTVDIPEAEFTPENVDKILSGKAATIEQVRQL